MEYRCLCKASLEKVYTFNYYQEKKKITEWNSWARLHFELACGSGQFFVIGVKWHTLRSCPGCFIFQQKWEKKMFLFEVNSCMRWFRLYLLVSVLWAKDSNRLLLLTPSQTGFWSTPWLKDILKIVKTKSTLIYWKKNIYIVARYGVKQKVSPNQMRIKGLPSCL